MEKSSQMPLYLAYDNLALRDGFGAQVLRIMGIFALARKYKLRYLHREMIETIQEFSHGVSEQKELDDLLKNVNTFFLFLDSKSRHKISSQSGFTTWGSKLF
jgi:hypothetical protein